MNDSVGVWNVDIHPVVVFINIGFAESDWGTINTWFRRILRVGMSIIWVYTFGVEELKNSILKVC